MRPISFCRGRRLPRFRAKPKSLHLPMNQGATRSIWLRAFGIFRWRCSDSRRLMNRSRWARSRRTGTGLSRCRELPGAPAPGPVAQTRNRGGGRGGFGRGGPPPNRAAGTAPGPAGRQPEQRQGFQSAAVTATQDGQQALSDAASAGAAGLGDLSASEADEAFLVNGSTSGGLAQSSDDETRRQRMMGRDGGPPFGGGPDGGDRRVPWD